ncbi:hypothetical protein C6A85_04270, partial [Mycobacterium sp. ITM-2017-0098]
QHLVTLVDVAPGADVNTVAALLNPVAPTITPASLSNDLAAAAVSRSAGRSVGPGSAPDLPRAA